MIRAPVLATTLLGLCAVTGCVVFPGQPIPRDIKNKRESAFQQLYVDAVPPPIPLRIPIKGVMAGIVDFSAHRIFEAAANEAPPTSEEWLDTGLAAINLVGASTLMTLPGTGPNDAEWVADPLYRRWAKEMQAASLEAGKASALRDWNAFRDASDRMATACQSCHDYYRIEVPPAGSKFADNSGLLRLR